MFGIVLIREKRLNEIIGDAVGKATGVGYRVGYEKAIADVNSIIDAHGILTGLKPQSESLAVKQATAILWKKEEKEGEL